MSRHPMTPKRGAELLLDYLDGTLDVDLVHEMDGYIADNAEFRAFVETYKTTIRVVGAALQQEVPKDAAERTLNFLRSQQSSSKVG